MNAFRIFSSSFFKILDPQCGSQTVLALPLTDAWLLLFLSILLLILVGPLTTASPPAAPWLRQASLDSSNWAGSHMSTHWERTGNLACSCCSVCEFNTIKDVLVHEKEISFLGSGSVNGGVSVLSCAGG
jgi:hypothetical protein